MEVVEIVEITEHHGYPPKIDIKTKFIGFLMKPHVRLLVVLS